MESSEKEVGDFGAFARKKLKNHLEELDVSHFQRQPDLSVIKQAFHEHEIILERELRDRIEEIADDKSENYIKVVLLQIKTDIVLKFQDKSKRSYADMVRKLHE